MNAISIKLTKKGILRRIRKETFLEIATINDIIPDSFVGGEIPQKTPFVFYTEKSGYVHVN